MCAVKYVTTAGRKKKRHFSAHLCKVPDVPAIHPSEVHHFQEALLLKLFQCCPHPARIVHPCVVDDSMVHADVNAVVVQKGNHPMGVEIVVHGWSAELQAVLERGRGLLPGLDGRQLM